MVEAVDPASTKARRRRWAGSGCMPPALASRFPEGEWAVLSAIAFLVAERGKCPVLWAGIGHLIGVRPSTVERALNTATGLLSIYERCPLGLPSITHIRYAEWVAHLARGDWFGPADFRRTAADSLRGGGGQISFKAGAAHRLGAFVRSEQKLDRKSHLGKTLVTAHNGQGHQMEDYGGHQSSRCCDTVGRYRSYPGTKTTLDRSGRRKANQECLHCALILAIDDALQISWKQPFVFATSATRQ